MAEYRFCPQCASPLAWLAHMEDSGETLRLRCTACDFTHWNNPTPVLAGIVQVGNQILLARNAAWPGRRFALITGRPLYTSDAADALTRLTPLCHR